MQPKPRKTFRRQAVIDELKAGPQLLSELRFQVWLSEWNKGKTKAVCSRSTNYRLSFNLSLKRWKKQGFISTVSLEDTEIPITYELAARLAISTLLERGQLSPNFPTKCICLYFGTCWCSVVVNLPEGHAANLGAIYIGLPSRYEFVSLEKVDKTGTSQPCISDTPWNLKQADNGHSIDPASKFNVVEYPRRSSYYQTTREERESRTESGIALAIKHQFPGGISPYMLTGEQVTADHFRKKRNTS